MKVKLFVVGEQPPGLPEAVCPFLPPPFAGGVVAPFEPDVAPCFDRRRRQLDAACLLDLVPVPQKGWAHLVVTDTDLCLPAVTYVFGLAELGSHRAVVSWARLREDDEEWMASSVSRRRLLIEAVHELGHALGLPHCPAPECAMHRSLWVESIDLKEPSYCVTCRGALDDFLKTAQSVEGLGVRG